MFEQLKNLVFGLNEYDKTKYELRFELIEEIIDNLVIKKIEDFEIIEDVIYKIRDQLRVNSSNLNKVINCPSKNLKKKNVLLILEKLSTLKYNFLKKAFNLNNNINENISIESKNITKNKLDIKSENLNFTKSTNNFSDIVIEDNNRYTIIFKIGKIPYILIKFKQFLDLNFINFFSSIFFKVYSPEATNIIINKNSALIIPRSNGDNLLQLNHIEDDKLNNGYELLKKKMNDLDENNNDHDDNINNISLKNNNISNSEDKQYIKNNKNEENNYLDIETINTKKNFKQSSKKKDNGLDDLLLEEVKSKEHLTSINKDNNNDIKFLKDEPIEIEKKQLIKSKSQKNESIEIITEEPKLNSNSTQKIKQDKKNNKNQEIKTNITNNNNEITNNNENDNLNQLKSQYKFQLYLDDKILIYLNENSKVFGEIIIKPLNNNFKDLNESDLSYISIFSKIFSSLIFDILKLHGTNIFYDFNSNLLKIIPRFQEDKLDIDWKPININEQTLDDITKKLISKLSEHIDSNSLNNQINNNIKIIDDVNNNNDINSKNIIESKNNNSENSLKDKAKYILESLKRIP